ncbi:hypothetical protein [Pelomonas sp. KK5]|uniref:hypothetical protein n=1 Tax=Pelomonas sp. KK5 TaxID=1855730 RepID=UPI00097BDCBE|nr:hypothetical protein [Pelomonas sp. KK5]
MHHRPLSRFLLAALVASSLAACGSGGGDSSSDGGGSSTPDPTPVAPGSAVSYAAAPTLAGVAAAGAPLTRATISVVDGKGQVVGTATSHAVDGSYSLTLTTKTPTVPLMVQARGMDASGTPQVLHSAVPAMSAASAAMVANVTPLSNAVVAMSLGADPAPVFAAASSSSASLTKLGNAAAAAATFLKTLVKTQLTDLKVSNSATLDLLGDASFAANKGAQDLLIESVRTGLGTNAANGNAQLRMGNKLLPATAPEVLLDLPTAQTELLKTTGGTPASAITSTLKATTSPTGTLANLASLDDLSVALNQLIAQAPSLATVTASTLLSVYDTNDGGGKSVVAAKLQGYAAKNWQLGRFQLTGCADATVTGGLCNRVQVSALVTDTGGAVVDLFADAVSYNKSSTTGSKWNLIGNGRALGIAAYPLAFRALNADGSASTAISPNPGTGVQIEMQAQDAAGAQLLSTATVQTPGGYGIAFAYCTQALMCISSTPGATLLVPTGGIGDTALQQAAVSWLGSADMTAGAKYVATFTPSGATAAQTRNVYLRAEVLASPASTRFPTLDGLTSTAPLRASEILAGRSLAWTAWAAANPDMRLISLRTVLSDGQSNPLVTDSAVPLPPTTSFALPALALGSSFVPTSYELWLGAQDSAGRRYYTRYTLTP